LESVAALDEPIIVVLGPFGGGTSAVASVLHHLGVFMGSGFDWSYREPHETWEDAGISQLCRKAFTVPGGRLQMNADSFRARLRSWADGHRHAARIAQCRPGVKQPLLCVAVDFIRDAWKPMVPVVVDRPFENVVGSLNRLGWWTDEQERAEATAHLIATRDLALAGAATVRVDFEALRATPEDAIRRLAHELHLNVTDAQVEEAVASILQPADVRDSDPYGLDLLLARVERNPDDARSVYIIAQIYWDTDDFANARKWYTRQVEMGCFPDEEIYIGMWRIAESMTRLNMPWLEVQGAYLRAWEFRPTRAEPLYAIAHRYRIDERYRLGYLFAERAARIPFPENDMLHPYPDVYAWHATDEQAICASRIGKHAEAFTLCRRLLARSDIPDAARQRIAVNRDFSVPAMIEATSAYPDELIRNLIAGTAAVDVTVSLVAGPDLAATEQTLNSFLHCCTDVSRVRRFVVLDASLSTQDRATLQQRYGFVEFADFDPGVRPPLTGGRLWLHLGRGWRFFAPENLITRLAAVLEAETRVFQVGINFADATELTGACASEQAVRRAHSAGRYVLTDVIASGPAMFNTELLNQVGGVNSTDAVLNGKFRRLSTSAGLHTATLDEVLCITAV